MGYSPWGCKESAMAEVTLLQWMQALYQAFSYTARSGSVLGLSVPQFPCLSKWTS